MHPMQETLGSERTSTFSQGQGNRTGAARKTKRFIDEVLRDIVQESQLHCCSSFCSGGLGDREHQVGKEGNDSLDRTHLPADVIMSSCTEEEVQEAIKLLGI